MCFNGTNVRVRVIGYILEIYAGKEIRVLHRKSSGPGRELTAQDSGYRLGNRRPS